MEANQPTPKEFGAILISDRTSFVKVSSVWYPIDRGFSVPDVFEHLGHNVSVMTHQVALQDEVQPTKAVTYRVYYNRDDTVTPIVLFGEDERWPGKMLVFRLGVADSDLESVQPYDKNNANICAARIPFLWEQGKDIDDAIFTRPPFRFYEPPKVVEVRALLISDERTYITVPTTVFSIDNGIAIPDLSAWLNTGTRILTDRYTREGVQFTLYSCRCNGENMVTSLNVGPVSGLSVPVQMVAFRTNITGSLLLPLRVEDARLVNECVNWYLEEQGQAIEAMQGAVMDEI